MKCNIHTIELGKKTYFVFVGVNNYRVHKVFVWKKKEAFFYLPNHKIDNRKAKMICNKDNTIDFYSIDKDGYKTTFHGLDRHQADMEHEVAFNSLLPDLDKAVLFVKGLNKKSLKDFKKCILLIFDK